MLGDVNKLFVFISLLTTPSNVLPIHFKQTFPPIIWIFTEGDGIQFRLAFKIFSTSNTQSKYQKRTMFGSSALWLRIFSLLCTCQGYGWCFTKGGFVSEGTDAFVISSNRQTLLFSWAWILKMWYFKGLKSCQIRAWIGSEGSYSKIESYLSLQNHFRPLCDMIWAL